MSDDLLKSHIDISFENSITSAEKFEKSIKSLDERFDSFDQKIKNIQTSMKGLSTSVGNKAGTDLRKKLEEEVSNIMQSQGLDLKLGNQPFKVSKTALDNLYRQIEIAVNNELTTLYKTATVKLEGGGVDSKINLTKKDVKNLKTAIVKVLKEHASNLAKSLDVQNSIPKDQLNKLFLTQGEVGSVVSSIKKQIMPLILNPKIDNTNSILHFTEKDIEKTLRKIKSSILKSVTSGLTNLKSTDIPDFDSGMRSIFKAYGRGIKKFTDSIKLDAKNMGTDFKIPFASIDADLKRYIANKANRQGESIKDYIKRRSGDKGDKVSSNDLIKERLEKDFSEISRTLYEKIRKHIKVEMKALKDSVNSLVVDDNDIREQAGFLSYINKEIDKIQKMLINHLRKLTKAQLEAMERELASISIQSPRTANVDSLIRRSALGGQVRQSTGTLSQDGFGSDQFARRDAHFNRFGIEGAVQNTIRHLIAGSVVGTPMMAFYQGLESFRTGQLEQVKMLQNLMIKDNYQKSSENQQEGSTKIDFNKVKGTVSSMQRVVEGMSLKYATDLSQMYQVSTIGSRLLDNPKDIQKFMEYSSQVKVIDNEADIAKVVAPGLEAIMSQFQISVDDLGDVVKAFAVATNATKATTQEILLALQRSGSLFHTSGIDVQSAIALSALTVQSTALSGENIGNFYKSLLVRLGSVETEKLLARNNVPVYEKNKMGGLDRRSGIDILQDVTKLFKTGDDALRDEIIRVTAGTYQAGKLTATVAGSAMENLSGIVEKMKEFTDSDLSALLTESTQNTRANMDRVRISSDIAFYSVLQDLSPQINTLTTSIVGLSSKIVDNSQGIAKLINIIAQMLLGFLAVAGIKKAFNASGYSQNLAGIKDNDKLFKNVATAYNAGRDSAGNRLITDDAVRGLNREGRFGGRNDASLQRGFADPVLRDYLRTLANADENRMSRFTNYVQQQGKVINTPAEFLRAFRDSVDFGVGGSTTSQVTDPNEQNRKANQRMNSLITGLNNVDDGDGIRSRFDANNINQTRGTNESMIRSLANFSDDDMRNIRNDLSGRSRVTFDDINDAVNRYQNNMDTASDTAQRQADATQRQTRELNNLNDSLDRVNRSALQNGMETFSDNVRNAGQHMRSLARTTLDVSTNVAKMAGEMLLMVGVGSVLQDVMTGFSQTATEREIGRATSDKDAVRKVFNYNSEDLGYWSQRVAIIVDKFNQGVESITGGSRVGFDDVLLKEEEVGNFIKDNKKINVERSIINGRFNIEKAISQIAKKENKTFNQVSQELEDAFLSRSGGEIDRLNNAKLDNSKAMMESNLISEDEARRLKEMENEKRKQINARLIKENRYNASTIIELVKREVEEKNREDKGIYKTEAKALEKKGYIPDSEEFVNIRKKQIELEKQMYQEPIDSMQSNLDKLASSKDLLNIGELRDGGAVFGNVALKEYNEIKSKLDQLNKAFQPLLADLDTESKELEFTALQSRVRRGIAENQFSMQKNELINNINLDPESKEYIDSLISLRRGNIVNLKNARREMESVEAIGNAKLQQQEQLNEIDLAILSQQKEIKDLSLSKIGIDHNKLSILDRKDEINLLKYRVENEIYDESDPRIKKKHKELMKDRANRLGSEVVRLEGLVRNAKDPQTKRLFEEQLLNIQEQSLKAQLGIHDTLKKGEGSFNLPKGVKPINEFDYFKAIGTGSSVVTQQGSTTLNFVINGNDPRAVLDTLQQGLVVAKLMPKGTAPLSLQVNTIPFRK